MDKTEALRTFIDENLTELTAPSTDKSLVKRMKKDFFHERGLSSSASFTYREIAEEVVEIIGKNRKDQDLDDIVADVLTLPFVLGELSQEDIRNILTPIVGPDESLLEPEDISKLRRDEYLKQVEEELEEKARKEAEKQLEERRRELDNLREEVERKKEDLEEYKSELDTDPPEIILEESPSPEDSSPQEPTVWWKELGLINNPFPSEEGLVGFSENLYDQIVVRTDFVDDYLTLAEDHPEELLGKAFAILGEFGSGKTTLFRMMSYKLGEKGVLPVHVILSPNPDAVRLQNELLSQVGDELCSALRAQTGIDRRSDFGRIDSLSKLGSVLDEWQDHGGEALLITVDGLHKGTQYLDQTWDFLQQLQNVHEYIEQRDIRTCMFVAGSLYWEKKLDNVPSMSGSIYKVEVIPSLSENDAVRAVDNRIKAFSPSTGTAPTLHKRTLRVAFRTLSQRLDKRMTFRDFLNHVRDRLKVGEYQEVGVSISAHLESIETVRTHVENSTLSGSYQSILTEIENIESASEVLSRVLPEVYERKGVGESSETFRNNRGIFHLLRQNGFIVKRSNESGPDPFVWSISPEVADVLRDIQDDYSIPPEHALSALFRTKESAVEEETTAIYGGLIQRLSDAATRWSDSWPGVSRILRETVPLLESLSQNVTDTSIEIERAAIITSTRNLVRCIGTAAGEPISDEDNWQRFGQTWFAPENSDEIERYCRGDIKGYESDAEIFGLLHQHDQILSQLQDLLRALIAGEQICRISGRELTASDARRIHRARKQFQEHNLREAVREIGEILESKVRDIAYPLMRAVWGESIGNAIPKDIKERLEDKGSRGHRRAKRDVYDNFFYDISRSEHSKIVFQKDVRRILFEPFLAKPDIEDFQEKWDLAFSLDDREAHRDRPSYFREHQTEINDVLGFLPRICEVLNKAAMDLLLETAFKYEKGAGVAGQFDFDLSQHIQIAEIRVSKEDGKRVARSLLASLERSPKDFLPLDNVLITEGVDPEVQLAAIKIMEQQELLDFGDGFEVEITEKGRNRLEEERGY